MKIGKEKGKRKRKGISSANRVGGEFGPAERERTRARGQAAHLTRQQGNDAGMAPWARAHMPEGGEADGARRGANWSEPDRR
jgi:hypothetical protein